MADKALVVVLDAAQAVLVAVVSGAAAMDQAVLRGRQQWWARWLP